MNMIQEQLQALCAEFQMEERIVSAMAEIVVVIVSTHSGTRQYRIVCKYCNHCERKYCPESS